MPAQGYFRHTLKKVQVLSLLRQALYFSIQFFIAWKCDN
ncbi:hypothetical protein SBF1_860004 [Candidatus Desulfosporosinus infrequens]|uniref:Uncharacterized protein n=1 Tax=Candidatus Desulfosporosinus infrequens TaxID=2043169 RepID=A0A2U3LVF5_9FIRM|nr:hypothetical protein SBF1_860004 [Candidatus Desulfosporosinus infrequens]